MKEPPFQDLEIY